MCQACEFITQQHKSRILSVVAFQGLKEQLLFCSSLEKPQCHGTKTLIWRTYNEFFAEPLKNIYFEVYEVFWLNSLFFPWKATFDNTETASGTCVVLWIALDILYGINFFFLEYKTLSNKWICFKGCIESPVWGFYDN